MLQVLLITQLILLFVTPIAVGYWLRRRLALSWRLFLGGGLAFVAGWIVASPFPPEIRVFLASIAQMGVLYLIYRYVLTTVTTEREAIMAGAGQGGLELIILALFFTLPAFAQMLSVRNATDAELISLVARAEAKTEEEVKPQELDDLREFIDEYWSAPWYNPLIQAIPSLTTLPIQMSLAVLVLGTVTHNAWRPLIGAMALHFLSRSLPVFAAEAGGLMFGIIVALFFGGIAIWFLRKLWPIVEEQTGAALREQRAPSKR